MWNTSLFSIYNKIATYDKKGTIVHLWQICQINWTITKAMKKQSASELLSRRYLGHMLNMIDSLVARPRAVGELLLSLWPVASFTKETRTGCKKLLLNY